eukprot:TCONS_00001675-protein
MDLIGRLGSSFPIFYINPFSTTHVKLQHHHPEAITTTNQRTSPSFVAHHKRSYSTSPRGHGRSRSLSSGYHRNYNTLPTKSSSRAKSLTALDQVGTSSLNRLQSIQHSNSVEYLSQSFDDTKSRTAFVDDLDTLNLYGFDKILNDFSTSISSSSHSPVSSLPKNRTLTLIKEENSFEEEQEEEEEESIDKNEMKSLLCNEEVNEETIETTNHIETKPHDDLESPEKMYFQLTSTASTKLLSTPDRLETSNTCFRVYEENTDSRCEDRIST